MRIFGKKPPPSATLLGRVVQVGGYELKVEAHLGEGGFASIYRVRDSSSGEQFALKHIHLQEGAQTREEVCHEAKMMKKVNGHANVLGLIAVAFGGGARGQETDAYMLLDLCTDTLFGYLQANDFKLSDSIVLDIFHSTCLAISHVHSQFPPIAHRDVKVENILRRKDGQWVLCDFGSASSSARRFENATDSQAEEEYLNKKTTPAYRAPEMWDLMQGYVIDTKVDIWALGCMLYLLCFGKLPFTGDSKLQVLSGKFVMPVTRPAPLRALISNILIVNPDDRPDILGVLHRVEATKLAVKTGDYSNAGTSTSTSTKGQNPSEMMIPKSQQSSAPQSNGSVASAKHAQHANAPGQTISMLAQASSLPGPTCLQQQQMDAAVAGHVSSNSAEQAQFTDQQGKNRRSASTSRTDLWVADFDDSQWPGERHSQAVQGRYSEGGMVDHQSRRASADVLGRGGQVHARANDHFQQQLLGELQLLRGRLKAVHEENMKLNGKVEFLEQQVFSQQETIKELQRMGHAQRMDGGSQAPVGWSNSGAGSEPPQGRVLEGGGRGISSRAADNSGETTVPAEVDPMSGKRGNDTDVHNAAAAESNSDSTNPASARIEHRGSFWETYASEGTDPPAANASNQSGHPHQNLQAPSTPIPAATMELRGNPGHRRIVSDPPPIDSWHLDDDPE
ncbi:hypothetical protein BSKO_01166 [Bryopsis sp. KO-2023]|nr:hypothetical protein BSKO_01166 [Bryopsis sp. KO-2023]